MYWLVIGLVVFLLGILVFRKGLIFGPLILPLLIIWFFAIIVIITYAQQHDDPIEQYGANAILFSATAFLSYRSVIDRGFKRIDKELDEKATRIEVALSQRFTDYKDANDRLTGEFQRGAIDRFGQFEKRIFDRLDRMDEKIDDLKHPKR